MPNITVCPSCSLCYEEVSEEEANSPNRRCDDCFRKSVMDDFIVIPAKTNNTSTAIGERND